MPVVFVTQFLQMAINPSIWGPSLWFFLHLIALNFPEKPSLEQKRKMLDFLFTLQHVLPCENCQFGFSKILRETLRPIDLETGDSFFVWTIRAHSMVNQKKGREPQNDPIKWKKHYKNILRQKT